MRFYFYLYLLWLGALSVFFLSGCDGRSKEPEFGKPYLKCEEESVTFIPQRIGDVTHMQPYTFCDQYGTEWFISLGDQTFKLVPQ